MRLRGEPDGRMMSILRVSARLHVRIRQDQRRITIGEIKALMVARRLISVRTEMF